MAPLSTPHAQTPDLSWDRATFTHIPAASRISDPQRPKRALFLDRDGLLIKDCGYLREPNQIQLMPGATDLLRAAQTDYCLIVVTNQSGIARGYFSEEDLWHVHAALVMLLAAQSAFLDALYYCPHLKSGITTPYNRVCDCRKPAPGMLQRAAKDWGLELGASLMIGDKPRDAEAGQAAGVKSILVGPPAATAFGAAPQHVDTLANLIPILRQFSLMNNIGRERNDG